MPAEGELRMLGLGRLAAALAAGGEPGEVLDDAAGWVLDATGAAETLVLRSIGSGEALILARALREDAPRRRRVVAAREEAPQRISAPLRVAGERWGQLIAKLPAGADGAAVAATLQRLADELAEPLAAAGAWRDQLRSAAEEVAMRRVATSIAGAAPTGEVFALMARELAGLLDADNAAVASFDPDDHYRVLGSWSRGGVPAVETGLRRPIDSETLAHAIRSTGGSARAVLRTPTDLPFRYRIGAPVDLGGGSWGAVVAMNLARPFPPSAEERLSWCSELAGMALATAQVRAADYPATA